MKDEWKHVEAPKVNTQSRERAHSMASINWSSRPKQAYQSFQRTPRSGDKGQITCNGSQGGTPWRHWQLSAPKDYWKAYLKGECRNLEKHLMAEMLTQQYSFSNVYQDKFSYTAECVYLEETTSAGKSLVFCSDAHDSYRQNTHTGFNIIQIRNSYLLIKGCKHWHSIEGK